MPDGYGELTPDVYLIMLENWLNYQRFLDKISKNEVRDTLQRARDLTAAGQPLWSLPKFDEIVGIKTYFTGIQPERKEEMTPYQKWQVERYYAEQGVGRAQEVSELKALRRSEQMMREQQRAQAHYATEERRKAGDISEAEKRRIFERARQQLLGELTGPRDWIQRWQAEHRINPYERNRPGVFGALEERRERGPSMFGPTEQFGPGTLGAFRRGAAFQESVAGLEARAGEVREKEARRGKEGELKRAPKTPPAPPWLARMYPSITAGAPIQKMAVGAPSPQAWGGLTSAQKAGWAGFAEWGGGVPEDLLTQMYRMAPQVPRRTRGWAPARQRIMI